MRLRSIKELDIDNKAVLIRCDFNVPLDDFGNITDDRRIRSAMQTIRYCIDRDCKIILASHLGRPGGEFNAKYSLSPVAKRLHTLLKQEILMAKDVMGEDAQTKAKALQPGEILLLENLRFENGETKNNASMAKALAAMSDIYINDAFGVSHRAHASVEGITHHFDDEHKAGGFLLQKEIEFFYQLLKKPVRPFVAIVGGSKVSGKLQALTNLLPKVDKLIIGGGMAFTFLKALGEDVGASLVEDELMDDALHIMEEAKRLGVKLYLPVDVVAAEKFSEDSVIKFVTAKEIPQNWMGLDIGPATVKLFSESLNDAQTILWNGPMGVYEMDKFAKGSTKLSHVVAGAHATTVVGGGDTADLVQRTGDDEEMTFISTGGGASLELLEGKTLPGVTNLMVKDET
ncbi:MAG: phosphoglycerate kinase [Campylobacterota bacterium]